MFSGFCGKSTSVIENQIRNSKHSSHSVLVDLFLVSIFSSLCIYSNIVFDLGEWNHHLYVNDLKVKQCVLFKKQKLSHSLSTLRRLFAINSNRMCSLWKEQVFKGNEVIRISSQESVFVCLCVCIICIWFGLVWFGSPYFFLFPLFLYVYVRKSFNDVKNPHEKSTWKIAISLVYVLIFVFMF